MGPFQAKEARMQLVPLQTDQTWPLAVRPHAWLRKRLNQQPSYLSELKVRIVELETEVKNAKHIGKSMHTVCAYMARTATDGSRKRGKGMAGVMELAEQSVRSCLQEHAVFVSEKIWPN